MAYEVSMERQHKPRSGLALGGLGCGWFEIRQDGTCQNWNLFNNRPTGRGRHFTWTPHSVLFFVLRCQAEGEEPRLFLLQIEESHGAAAIVGHEYHYMFPWMSGVDRIDYSASFPFARLRFAAQGLPLAVELEAWSPFIPHDVKHSSLPVACFDFVLRSTSPKPLTVSLLGSLRNCVGYDVRHRSYASRMLAGEGFRAFEMTCTDMDPAAASFGSMGLASAGAETRAYLGWEHHHPYYERLLREPLLPELDDTPGRNLKDPATGRPSCLERCFSTIGQTFTLATAGASATHSFLAAWHFPNRYARPVGDPDYGPDEAAEKDAGAPVPAHLEGHWYSNFFANAGEVTAYVWPRLAWLKAQSRQFHEAFFAASLPPAVLDQVNSQLNTFRTSSWLTKAGDFGILEGLSPTRCYAGLSTLDVAMYGQLATTALFPELDRAALRAYRRLQFANGVVCHSIAQNFSEADPREGSGTRLDLPAQYVCLVLRAAAFANDRAFLAEVWPSVVRTLEYVLRERDQNGDGLPDMTGIMCSYDNFPMYGVAPYVATQWLAALAAATEAAAVLGEQAAAARYSGLLERGRSVLERQAWNGSYYRLYNDDEGGHGGPNEGCLSDQLIGHWACRLSALPPFLQPERVHSALRCILAMNYRADQGLRGCQWPGDSFLHPIDANTWVDQANTCWTGVELAVASLLVYEGMAEEGFELVRNVDARYRRWGMAWDHQEFGGHYFRPMSAWALVPAALGFSASYGCLSFAPRLRAPGKWLFVSADGYGHCEWAGDRLSLRVLAGALRANSLRFELPGAAPGGWQLRVAGQVLPLAAADGAWTARFSSGLTVPAGQEILLVRP